MQYEQIALKRGLRLNSYKWFLNYTTHANFFHIAVMAVL